MNHAVNERADPSSSMIALATGRLLMLATSNSTACGLARNPPDANTAASSAIRHLPYALGCAFPYALSRPAASTAV